MHSNNKINSCEHHHLVFTQVDCCTLMNASPNMHDEGTVETPSRQTIWLTQGLTGSDDHMQ